jgi:hypothetical protein
MQHLAQRGNEGKRNNGNHEQNTDRNAQFISC